MIEINNLFEWIKLALQVALFAVALFVGSMINDLTDLVRETGNTVREAKQAIVVIQKVVEAGPEQITQTTEALSEGTGEIVETVGTKSNSALGTIGDAVRDWRKPKPTD